MPKIPTYNQGQQVPLATGQLGPRLSGAGLEQGMLAGVRTTQQAFGAVADIATAFEKRRQAELEETFTADTINDFEEKALEFNLRDQSQNINEYNVNFDAFLEEYKGSLDTPNISKTRNRRALSKLDASAQQFRLNGIKKAFDVELSNTTNSIEKAGQNIISQFVSGQMPRDLAIASYSEQFDRAKRNGVDGRVLSVEQFGFSLDKQKLVSISNEEDLSLDDAEALIDEILTGESVDIEVSADGQTVSKQTSPNKYAAYLPSEREELANVLMRRIGKMETEEVSAIQSKHANLKSFMALASSDDEFENAAFQSVRLADRLDKIGREDDAQQIREELAGIASARLFFNEDNVFSSDDDLEAAYQSERESILRALTESNASEQVAKLTALEAGYAEINKRRSEDPALFVQTNFERQNQRLPDISEVVAIQKEMGLEDFEIRPLTNSQVKELVSEVQSAQTPEDVQRALSFVDANREIAPQIMGQLRTSGITLSDNWVANRPDLPMSEILLKATRPGAITIGVTQTNRDLVSKAVRANQEYQSHSLSMLGGFFSDFEGDEVVGAASDSVGYDRARKEHLDMLTNLTIYLAQEAGEVFSGDMKLDEGSIGLYVEQAAKLITERYDYSDAAPNKQTTMRLPVHLSAHKRKIDAGFKMLVDGLTVDSIFYSSNRGYEVGSPEYNIEKQQYLEEIKATYGVITQNDDASAIVTDASGGVVFVQTEDGVMPLSSTFQKAWQRTIGAQFQADVRGAYFTEPVPSEYGALAGAIQEPTGLME